MSKKMLYSLWGALFVLCAVLGLLPDAGIWGIAAALVFFLPPALLLYRGDREIRRLIRNLAALSLGLTALALVVSMLTAAGSEALGNSLHYVLGIVSVPMFAARYWVLSLFLWACLLVAARQLTIDS